MDDVLIGTQSGAIAVFKFCKADPFFRFLTYANEERKADNELNAGINNLDHKNPRNKIFQEI